MKPERGARAWVGVLFALLLVPGLIGFEFWPLTGWRMYSVAATDTRVDWAVAATTATEEVDLGWADLPLAYRLAAWVLEESSAASPNRRDEMCRALLEGVRSAVPNASGLTLVRTHRTLSDGGDVTEVEREEFHWCGDE